MATAIQQKALCYGQKFGHDFQTTGGACFKCGIDQSKLHSGLEKIEYFVKKPEKGMHSETHALAKEISEFCGEPKKFGMYLGIIKNMGLQRAYQIFAELRQAKKIETPGKLFVYLSARNKSQSFKPKEKSTNGNSKRTSQNPTQKTKKRRKNNS